MRHSPKSRFVFAIQWNRRWKLPNRHVLLVGPDRLGGTSEVEVSGSFRFRPAVGTYLFREIFFWLD